ncbi:MAG: hypothetical protein P1V18_01080 [Candidatus Gracilibacteria bacterium]|nr:hypothetical protein [Candidatus Gracilibacteria bacterium]
MVHETLCDTSEMVDKCEEDRLNGDFFKMVESEIRDQIGPVLKGHKEKLIIRSALLERELYFSACLWGVVFLKSLDKIMDHHIYEVINSVVDSDLNMKQKQYVLDFMIQKIDREIDQEKADLIEIYKKILQITPQHIKNRLALVQDLNECSLDVSLEYELPLSHFKNTKMSALRALEILGQDLENSLIFMMEEEQVTKELSKKHEKPSDMEISIDMILPDNIYTELEEEMNEKKDLECDPKEEVQLKPIRAAQQQREARIPIEDAIRQMHLRQGRQRSYPPYEKKSRAPHFETE